MDVKQLQALGFTRAEILAAALGTPVAPAQSQSGTPPELQHLIGRACVVRCRGEGVHAGVVRSVVPSAAGGVVVLEPGSVRLWRWFAGGNGRTLSAVAQYGVVSPSRTETSASERTLLEACGLEPCTDAAWSSIRAAGWAQ